MSETEKAPAARQNAKTRQAGKYASKPRPGEVIGGGHFVFRRGKRTKRVRPSWLPYEHASYEEALAEAEKLAAQNPGETFVVMSQVAYARSCFDHAFRTGEAA